LNDADGRHYGFELTFFRVALTPEPAVRTSSWGTNQVWMAHFAVTDTASGRFVANERFARGALGLAGASAAPFRVWTEQWSVEGNASGAEPRFTLRARAAEAALELELVALKPPVLHGDRGLDAKGPEPGNASYYYSLPRLAARGQIQSGVRRATVDGLAWMDREWSTSALSPGVVGWDWFALQLSDGRDLMFYRLRLADGSASPFSGGSLIERDGTRKALSVRDVELVPNRVWRSPRTKVRYPVAWRLVVPGANLDLAIEARLDDQELDLAVRYWEGAVEAADRAGAITAVGYLELAGY
jgi:predicted secreted hydrolase